MFAELRHLLPLVVTSMGVLLVGCSENYTDRRDTVSPWGGDAMATNRITQMIDPWPAASGNRDIAYNGERAAHASERYRTGRVIKPVTAMTSSAAYAQPQSMTSEGANK